jgi:transcriptional regulator with XRE-family HTH domain
MLTFDFTQVPVSNSDQEDEPGDQLPSGQLAADAVSQVSDASVGAQIRHVRLARGLSLRQVATEIGLSVGLLSQIERGVSSASVRVLALAADALSVGVADFLSTHKQDSSNVVTRASERDVVCFGTSGMVKELLTLNGERHGLDMFIMRMAGPEDGSGVRAYSHEGIEAGLVISGGFELEVSQRSYVLGEGDACCFPSTLPHKFKNAGSREAVVLWVNYRQSHTLDGPADASDEPQKSNNDRRENLP